MDRSGSSRTSCVYHQRNLALLSLTNVTSFIIFILDWIGRKKPLMFGAASLVALFSILSALVALFPPGKDQNLAAQKAAIGMTFLMSIVFSLSFGPVSWVLASEVSRAGSQSCILSVLTEGPSGVSHPDALHWHERCYVHELVVQRSNFRNVTDWDGQRWLEILPTLRLSERSGLYHHRGILPRNQRQVVLPEVPWSCIVLTGLSHRQIPGGDGDHLWG